MIITEPGIYDIPEDQYHADPVPESEGRSLSSSGAKLLLPPGCPAIYKHQRDHGGKSTKAMDTGTVVHGMILGTGREVAVLSYDNYQTGKARDARDKAIADGKLPQLRKEWDKAAAIAQAVRDHPTAGALFSEGDAEQSGFWRDPELGVWRRCRWDWITPHGEVADLKTCADASPQAIAKAMHNFGYYMQNAWYRDGYTELFGDEPWDFLNVFVQAEPPYLITIARLTGEHVELGRRRCRAAIEKFRDCTEAGVWPAWSDDIIDISLPRYAEMQIESEILHDYDY